MAAEGNVESPVPYEVCFSDEAVGIKVRNRIVIAGREIEP
jgi:hypothetical protein